MNNRKATENAGLDKQISRNGVIGRIGKCVLCRNVALVACERCIDAYCSVECQNVDWRTHRYICFPKPKLVPFCDLLEEESDEKQNEGVKRIIEESKEKKQDSVADDKNVNKQSNENGTKNNQNQNSSETSVENERTTSVEGSLNTDSLFDNKEKDKNVSKVLSTDNKSSKNAASTSQKTMMLIPKKHPKYGTYVLLLSYRESNLWTMCSKQDGLIERWEILDKVDECGKASQLLLSLPAAKSYAFAPLNGKMHRVQVMVADSVDNIRVRFLDFGSDDIRKLSELRAMSDEILRLPLTTFQVKLSKLYNLSKSEQLGAIIKAHFCNKTYKFKFGPKDAAGQNVTLYSADTGVCFNDEILKISNQILKSENIDIMEAIEGQSKKHSNSREAIVPESLIANKRSPNQKTPSGSDKDNESMNAGYLTASKRSDKCKSRTANNKGNESKKVISPSLTKISAHPVMEEPFKMDFFKKGTTNLKAIVLDTSSLKDGFMPCIAVDNIAHFQKIHHYLSNFSDTTPYSPQSKEFCIARFEGDWYRARALEVLPNSQFNMYYLDFGNQAVLSPENIRRYPSDLNIDCFSNMCTINDLNNDDCAMTPELLIFLEKEIVVNSPIIIDKVLDIIDNSFVTIEMRDLYEKAHALNLI